MRPSNVDLLCVVGPLQFWYTTYVTTTMNAVLSSGGSDSPPVYAPATFSISFVNLKFRRRLGLR